MIPPDSVSIRTQTVLYVPRGLVTDWPYADGYISGDGLVISRSSDPGAIALTKSTDKARVMRLTNILNGQHIPSGIYPAERLDDTLWVDILGHGEKEEATCL